MAKTRTKQEWFDFCGRVTYDANALARTYIEEPQKPGQSMLDFREELGERYGLSGSRVEELSRQWGWYLNRKRYQKILTIMGADTGEMKLADWMGGDAVAEWVHGKHLMMMRDVRHKLEESLKVIPPEDPTKLGAWILAYDRFRKIPTETAKDAPQLEDAQVSDTDESNRLDDLDAEVDDYIPLAPGMYEQDLVKEQESRDNVDKWKKLSAEDDRMNHVRAGGELPDE